MISRMFILKIKQFLYFQAVIIAKIIFWIWIKINFKLVKFELVEIEAFWAELKAFWETYFLNMCYQY